MGNKKNIINCFLILTSCLTLCTSCTSGVEHTLKNSDNQNSLEQSDQGIGVASIMAKPEDSNTFEIGEPVVNNEFDGSQIEYTVLEAKAYNDITESGYSYNDLPQGTKEYYEQDKTLTEDKVFLLIKIKAKALTETPEDSPLGKNVHILSMGLCNEELMYEEIDLFDVEEKDGAVHEKKDEKQYFYFALPAMQEAEFYLGFFVNKKDVEEKLLLSVGTALEDYQYFSLKVK